MYRVLMVDDDPAVLEINEKYFTSLGYQVQLAAQAETALSLIKESLPDCIILDIDLPGEDGFTLCARIREAWNLPIVFLSCFSETQSVVRGLTIGGDDYLTKPYSLEELELRCRLRIEGRLKKPNSRLIQMGVLTLDPDRRTVSRGDRLIKLTALEMDVLLFLASNPGRVFSYEEIYQQVWDAPLINSLHTLHVYMSKIRQSISELCPEHDYVKTVRGRGYEFVLPEGESTL